MSLGFVLQKFVSLLERYLKDVCYLRVIPQYLYYLLLAHLLQNRRKIHLGQRRAQFIRVWYLNLILVTLRVVQDKFIVPILDESILRG